MNQSEIRQQNLLYFQSHSTGSIPYAASLGSKKEPHAIIIGATHGNEPAGVEAIARYHAHLASHPQDLHGMITFVLGNPEGYARNVRYCDEDFNRAFKEKGDKKTIEQKRVEEIKKLLVESRETKTFVLDLHSVSRGNFKMTVYSADNEKNREMAEQVSPLSLHFSYHEKHLKGLLLGEASKLGYETLAIECGNHESPDSVDTAIDHINRLLLRYAIISEQDLLSCSEPLSEPLSNPLDQQPRRTYETIAAICPGRDFYFLDETIVSESFLRKGEAFAWDRDVGNHIAPQDCYALMPSKTINTADIDAGFLCAKKE